MKKGVLILTSIMLILLIGLSIVSATIICPDSNNRVTRKISASNSNWDKWGYWERLKYIEDIWVDEGSVLHINVDTTDEVRYDHGVLCNVGSDYIVNANGIDSPATITFKVTHDDITTDRDVNKYSLVGKIDRRAIEAKKFFVGTNFDWLADRSGLLYLAFNDRELSYGDNCWDFDTIEIYCSPPGCVTPGDNTDCPSPPPNDCDGDLIRTYSVDCTKEYECKTSSSPDTDCNSIGKKCIDGVCVDPILPACGDNIIQNFPPLNEECEDENLDGKDCTDIPGSDFDGGTLKCSNCLFDTSGCTTPSVPYPYVEWTDGEKEINEVIVTDIGTTSVFLTLKDSDLPDDSMIDFNIKERDTGFDNDIRTITGSVVGGDAEVEWVISQTDLDKTPDDYEEFYFEVDSGSGGILTSRFLSLIIPSFCAGEGITLCGQYTPFGQEVCEKDECSIADDEINGIRKGKVCDRTTAVPDDGNPGCEYVLKCGCVWKDNECKAGFGSEIRDINECSTPFPSTGICTYTEATSDNCDDGFLSFSWTAVWGWDEVNNEFCIWNPTYCENIPEGSEEKHYDPVGDFSACSKGDDTLPCPGQIQLPFFGVYGMIISIITIILIYFILILRTKK